MNWRAYVWYRLQTTTTVIHSQPSQEEMAKYSKTIPWPWTLMFLLPQQWTLLFFSLTCLFSLLQGKGETEKKKGHGIQLDWLVVSSTLTTYFNNFNWYWRWKKLLMKAHQKILSASISIICRSLRMDPSVLTGCRDRATLALIHLFRLSYFAFSRTYFLFRHFSRTPEVLFTAQSVVFYGEGVILWYFSSIAYQTLWFFYENQATV